jgi:hypothetical protein
MHDRLRPALGPAPPCCSFDSIRLETPPSYTSKQPTYPDTRTCNTHVQCSRKMPRHNNRSYIQAHATCGPHYPSLSGPKHTAAKLLSTICYPWGENKHMKVIPVPMIPETQMLHPPVDTKGVPPISPPLLTGQLEMKGEGGP